MKIKANVSFSGVISMAAGELRECNDAYILTDLLSAGYVEEVKEAEKAAPKRKAVKPVENK